MNLLTRASDSNNKLFEFCRLCLCGALMMLAGGVKAVPIVTPIDLNDFYFFPGDPVVVAPDGSSATLAEDALLLSVILSNDPGLGDPNVIIPGLNTVLKFDFEFDEPAGNENIFVANLLDGITGSPLAGFGASFTSSAIGSITFNLATLVGSTLGLQFELAADFGDQLFDSTVRISNLRLETEQTVGSVVSPGVPWLVLAAGVAMALGRRRKSISVTH